MYLLLTLVCVFLLLAFTSYSIISASSAIGEAVLRSERSLSELSDLPEGGDVIDDVVEKETFNELNEDDVNREVLMPAGLCRPPLGYKCVHNRQSRRIRCFPSPQVISTR